MNQYLTGSKAFFYSMSDFRPHDTDIVEFDTSIDYPMKIVSFGGISRFVWKYDNANDIINFMLKNQKPYSQVIMLLVSDIAERIKLKIDDLQRVKVLVDNIDDKHNYIKIIYKYVILNNSFSLTNSQLLEAYEEYLKYRK